MADNECKECGSNLVPIRTYAIKKCSGCGAFEQWLLHDGQKPVGYSVCPSNLHKITEEVPIDGRE